MMETHEDYIGFSTAKRLKKLGFEWNTTHFWYEKRKRISFGSYNNYNGAGDYLSAPTLEQTSRWLREEKGYHIKVEPAGNLWGYIIYEYSKEDECYWDFYICDEEDFSTYEEALSDAIYMITGLLEQGKDKV